LPDLIHVYVLLEAVEVIPAFLHVLPAFTAAFAGTRGTDKKREEIAKNAIFFFSMNRS
jgi:hypothetical protein